jgi:TM2 domain-containing membrane protein YozV
VTSIASALFAVALAALAVMLVCLVIDTLGWGASDIATQVSMLAFLVCIASAVGVMFFSVGIDQ